MEHGTRHYPHTPHSTAFLRPSQPSPVATADAVTTRFTHGPRAADVIGPLAWEIRAPPWHPFDAQPQADQRGPLLPLTRSSPSCDTHPRTVHRYIAESRYTWSSPPVVSPSRSTSPRPHPGQPSQRPRGTTCLPSCHPVRRAPEPRSDQCRPYVTPAERPSNCLTRRRPPARDTPTPVSHGPLADAAHGPGQQPVEVVRRPPPAVGA